MPAAALSTHRRFPAPNRILSEDDHTYMISKHNRHGQTSTARDHGAACDQGTACDKEAAHAGTGNRPDTAAGASYRVPAKADWTRMLFSMILQRMLALVVGLCLLCVLLFGSVRLLMSLSDHIQGTGIPVLAYHAVTDETWGDASMFISPPQFERQLRTLRNKGYRTVTFADLAASASWPANKAVMITFDDGYDSVWTTACPLLRQYGFRAVLFQPVGNRTDRNPEWLEQARENADCIEIQSHTFTHPDLTKCDDDTLHRELAQSAEALGAWTGTPPLAVSYSLGKVNARVESAAGESYRYGVMTLPGLYRPGTDPLRIPRLTQTPVVGRLLFTLYIR